MVQNKELLRLHLQLFAEGGDTGAGPGAPAGAAGQQQGVGNPLEDVVYGIQPGANAQNAAAQHDEAPAQSPEERQNAYDEFIKANKDLDDLRVQNIVQKRLAKTKDTVDKYNALAPLLDMLGEKYQVDATDVKALQKAMEEDRAFYEDEAARRGISVEEVKLFRKMERENENLRKMNEEMQARENADRLYQRWLQQAETVKQIYPSFDLQQELQNPAFLDLLKSPNIDVRTAFEAIHHDEVISNAMQFTAKTVEKKIANKIAANGARPQENGLSSQSAALVKSDVSQLTKADIDEVIRRVQQGEKISFG